MEQAPSAAAGSGTSSQPVSSVSPKELESENLAASPGKRKGQEPPQVPTRSGRYKHEIKRNSQEHTCPYCLHPFVHLSNYRKHIREACLLKKKKNKRMGDASDASFSPNPLGADDSRSLERAECSAATNMSLKEPVENSVINMLRNQSKQVELIGAQAAALKHQPCGVIQSPPNFMTFSCTVCHKIFLSYVKMLQHRLSHKLQTDEPSEKEEKADMPDAVAGVDVSPEARHHSAGEGQADHCAAPVAKADEKCLGHILVGAQASVRVESSFVPEELDPNCMVSLAELDSLPDDDDDDDGGNEGGECSSSFVREGTPQISTQNKTKTARAVRKRSTGKRRPRSKHASSKGIVQRSVPGRAVKTTSHCQH